jgi:hypothetical protein
MGRLALWIEVGARIVVSFFRVARQIRVHGREQYRVLEIWCTAVSPCLWLNISIPQSFVMIFLFVQDHQLAGHDPDIVDGPGVATALSFGANGRAVVLPTALSALSTGLCNSYSSWKSEKIGCIQAR